MMGSWMRGLESRRWHCSCANACDGHFGMGSSQVVPDYGEMDCQECLVAVQLGSEWQDMVHSAIEQWG